MFFSSLPRTHGGVVGRCRLSSPWTAQPSAGYKEWSRSIAKLEESAPSPTSTMAWSTYASAARIAWFLSFSTFVIVCAQDPLAPTFSKNVSACPGRQHLYFISFKTLHPNDFAGYELSNLQYTTSGLTAQLSLDGAPCNAFGNDIANLTIEVNYETSSRCAHQTICRFEIAEDRNADYMSTSSTLLGRSFCSRHPSCSLLPPRHPRSSLRQLQTFNSTSHQHRLNSGLLDGRILMESHFSTRGRARCPARRSLL